MRTASVLSFEAESETAPYRIQKACKATLSGAGECSEFTKVRARRSPGDAAEVVDQMGLIDVAEVRGNMGSVGIGKRESLHHFL